MEFRITFGILPGEYEGEAVDLARVEDASAEAADEAQQRDPAATVSVQQGSTGKGAAGPGIELVLHVAEEVLNDGASVFGWGRSSGRSSAGSRGAAIAVFRSKTRRRSASWPRPRNRIMNFGWLVPNW
jgi:hypothetical protein